MEEKTNMEQIEAKVLESAGCLHIMKKQNAHKYNQPTATKSHTSLLSFFFQQNQAQNVQAEMQTGD